MVAVKFEKCARENCWRLESPQYGLSECSVHARQTLGEVESHKRYLEGTAYTVRCLRCGYKAIPAGAHTLQVETVLQGFAVGNCPMSAVTCPECNSEVQLEHVSRGRVICAWHDDLRDPANAGASHGICHQCEMKMLQEGRGL